MKLYTEEQVDELMVLLQKSFLPENLECDGAHCMGCWKDIVRETLKKMVNLTPIELPNDDDICDEAERIADNYSNMKRNHYWGLEEGAKRMAYWLMKNFEQKDNGKYN
jgi:hypothetical protein